MVNAFDKISSHIFSLKLEYEGSREFSAIRLSDVIKNKTIYVSSVDVSGGIGESQNNNKNSNYQLELFSMDWYVYNDNYGTSEEKLFIKHFNREIKPLLEEKGLKFFLIRNERIPELAIYSFSDGERFEPDFLLFVQKENIDNESNYQAYIEPKGSHLLLKDAWKEKFLLEIEENHKIEQNVITMSNDYVVLGLPFFNSNERRNEFDNAVNEWIKKI